MKRLLILCIVVSLISCEDPDAGLESNPIDSNIVIEAREVLEPDARRLTFFCKTEHIYPCSNFPILTEQQTTGTAFTISFTSVFESTTCATALGPATTLIDLDAVANGEYQIKLNNGNFQNTGTLRMTDTDISLEFEQTTGIDFARTNTKRVPDKTYWGTIGYHVPSSSPMVDEFIKKFTGAGAMFLKQSPGHYFYYEIDNTGEIVTDPENSGYHYMKNFIFQYDGDESKLKDLVQVEAKNHKEVISLRLWTYKGELFNNWSN